MRNGFGETRRGALGVGLALLASPAVAAMDTAPRLYQRSIVLDGNLIAGSLFEQRVINAATSARIRRSGLTALKQTLGGTSASFTETEKDIAELKAAISRNSGLFTQITQADQIAMAKRDRKVGIIFSFETAGMHEGRIANIEHFASEGVRVMGLSYNKGSPFGGGTLQGGDVGLTPLGREAVARMVALGVTVDISHSNEATGFDAIAAANAPVLITHAGSAAVQPHPRKSPIA